MSEHRKGLSHQLKSARLKKGNIMAFQNGKMCMLKWCDKPIFRLSTIRNAEFAYMSNRYDKNEKNKNRCSCRLQQNNDRR